MLSFQTPYSCCNPLSPRDCIYKDVVNQSMHGHKYVYDSDVNLFRIGCKEALANSIGLVWWYMLTVCLYSLILYEVELVSFIFQFH